MIKIGSNKQHRDRVKLIGDVKMKKMKFKKFIPNGGGKFGGGKFRGGKCRRGNDVIHFKFTRRIQHMAEAGVETGRILTLLVEIGSNIKENMNITEIGIVTMKLANFVQQSVRRTHYLVHEHIIMYMNPQILKSWTSLDVHI